MDRSEHLQWAKDRALEYIQGGQIQEAIESIFSDLGKHPETKDHPGIILGVGLLLGNHLSTEDKARKFIEDFN